MVRYFGQSPDYWLDTCTLQAWNSIWSRELIETPPAEFFLSAYFKYQPPGTTGTDPGDGDDEPEAWDCPYPDMTE